MATVPPFGDALFWTKAIWTLLLFSLTVLCCVSPIFIFKKTGKNSKIIMSYMNALAGGVVLGALLMHMIPEITAAHSHHDHGHKHKGDKPVEGGKPAGGDKPVGDKPGDGKKHKEEHKHGHGKHKHKDGGCEYPWGPLAAGVSFLVLFSVDRIFMAKNEDNFEEKGKNSAQHEHKHKDHSHGHSHEHGEHGHDSADHSHEHGDHCSHSHDHSHDHSHEHSHEHSHDHPHEHSHSEEEIMSCNHEKGECVGDQKQTPAGEKENQCPKDCDHCSIEICQDRDCQDSHKHEQEHGHGTIGGCCNMDQITSEATQRQTLVFVIALSLHSFLEGLGMASKNSHSSLMSFLISLFAHKWLEAFTLGVAVVRAKYSSARTFSLLFFYSILTPLSMMGSIFLKGLAGKALGGKLNLILDGSAAGSFLFVSCIEMIPPEFAVRTKHSPFKFLALILGFTFMAVIQKFHKH